MFNLSWLDVAMVVTLVASIGFGFHQGLLRQLLLLLAIYVATVLSAQYHEVLAGIIKTAIPSSSLEVARIVAFVTLGVATTLVVTWAVWRAYRETRLPSVFVLDRVGGAALGGLIGVIIIGITIPLLRYALQAPWPEGSAIKYALHVGFLNSSLEALFLSPLPLIQTTLAPWLPSGIPQLLVR